MLLKKWQKEKRMSETKTKWLNVGSLCSSKKGSLYIKIENDITLKKGQYLNLQDAEKGLNFAVEKGSLTREKADEILQFKKYDVVLPPREG